MDSDKCFKFEIVQLALFLGIVCSVLSFRFTIARFMACFVVFDVGGRKDL
jgi:hypothetical protein